MLITPGRVFEVRPIKSSSPSGLKPPFDLIKLIKPDIIVKGGDYSEDTVVGSDLAKVVIFDFLKGYSTSKTIRSIADR